PALADRLRGDLGDGRALARLPAAAPAAGHRRLPEAGAEVRRDLSGVTRAEIARRLATAAVGIPLLIPALFWGPPAVLVGVAAAGTLLAAAYLGGLGGTLAGLRLAPAALGGPWVMMLLLTTVMSADSAALFAGSAVGRHKMAPRISPAKTWEGFVGGLVGGIAG